MVPACSDERELVVLYSIVVRVGGQQLDGSLRRYREFAHLHKLLQHKYPHLFDNDAPLDASPSSNAGSSGGTQLPPFPRKYLLRAGWDPTVVMERVRMLNSWLGAVCNRLQLASIEIISFLNVPVYAAVRMLSGDLQVRRPRPRGAEAWWRRGQGDESTQSVAPNACGRVRGGAHASGKGSPPPTCTLCTPIGVNACRRPHQALSPLARPMLT